MKNVLIFLGMFTLFACTHEDFEPKRCYECETWTTQHLGDKVAQTKTFTDKCGLKPSDAREIEEAASSSTVTVGPDGKRYGTDIRTNCSVKN